MMAACATKGAGAKWVAITVSRLQGRLNGKLHGVRRGRPPGRFADSPQLAPPSAEQRRMPPHLEQRRACEQIHHGHPCPQGRKVGAPGGEARRHRLRKAQRNARLQHGAWARGGRRAGWQPRACLHGRKKLQVLAQCIQQGKPAAAPKPASPLACVIMPIHSRFPVSGGVPPAPAPSQQPSHTPASRTAYRMAAAHRLSRTAAGQGEGARGAGPTLLTAARGAGPECRSSSSGGGSASSRGTAQMPARAQTAHPAA